MQFSWHPGLLFTPFLLPKSLVFANMHVSEEMERVFMCSATSMCLHNVLPNLSLRPWVIHSEINNKIFKCLSQLKKGNLILKECIYVGSHTTLCALLGNWQEKDTQCSKWTVICTYWVS